MRQVPPEPTTSSEREFLQECGIERRLFPIGLPHLLVSAFVNVLPRALRCPPDAPVSRLLDDSL
jgi:hypothetical protein